MSSDIVVEDVPRFTRRYGDYVFEGSNSTIAIFGTDRASNGPAKTSDGLGHINAPNKGKGTATIHFIAGRDSENPDFVKDRSFVYITAKSKIDKNLGIENVETASNDVSGIVAKSDVVRVVGRKNIKICANDDEKHYFFMDGNKMKMNFNSGATVEITEKKVVVTMGSNTITMDSKRADIVVSNTKLGMDGSLITLDSPKLHFKGGCQSPWDTLYSKIITALQSHDHVTAVGPTGPANAGPVGAALINALTADKATWKIGATE